MLQRMRDSLGKWVVVGVLGLIAFSFIFWGVDFGNREPQPDNPNKRSFDDSLVMTRNDPHPSALRSVAKQLLAAPSILALRQAGKAQPQLSADGALAERKERLREVLIGIRRDYF